MTGVVWHCGDEHGEGKQLRVGGPTEKTELNGLHGPS